MNRLSKFTVPEIIFGRGARWGVTHVIKALDIERPFLVADDQLLDSPWLFELKSTLAESALPFAIWRPESSPPRDYQITAGAHQYLEEGCDGLIALGSAGAMDAAKCIGMLVSNGGHILDYIGVDRASEALPPLVMIPTTAGSAADVSGLCVVADTASNRQVTLVSKNLVPDISLVDPVLLTTLPPDLAAASTISQVIERRNVQRALRLAQFSIDHAADAMLWVDADGRILEVNEAARRRLGCPQDELVGAHLLEISPNQTPQTLVSVWETLKERGSLGYADVHRSAHGHLFPVEITANYLHFESDEFAFLVARDITERQQAEAALHASEARLQYLTSQMPLSVWSTDRDLRMTYHSGALTDDVAEVMASSPPGELSLVQILETLYDNETVTARLKHLQQALGGKIIRYGQQSGSTHIENVISPLRDGSGEIIGLVGLAIDETDRRQLEDRANQSQRLEALGKLAGGIAHDFNNLLTGIIGNLSLAELDAHPGIRPMLTDADRAARRAASLTRQLLTFARQSPAAMQPIDLNEVVGEAASLIRETIDRRIDMIVDLRENLPRIRGDSTQLNQVVMNLLVNGRDAITECLSGTRYPHRRNDTFIIAVTTQEVLIDPAEALLDDSAHAGRCVVLSVADNGAGMDAATRGHIFEPFFTTKTDGKGTGLGLSTAHGILQQHEGWVNVYSEPGRGTTFRIYLPAIEAGATPEPDVVAAPAIRGGSETVLVADDEELVLNLCRRILEGLGYRVMTAADGSQAVTTFLQHAGEIDLVILDLSMPVLSGREVMEQIQAVAPTTRIIIASGYTSDAQRVELLDEGACAYVQKPYHVADLAGAVRAVLDG